MARTYRLNAIELTWTFTLKQGSVAQDIAEFSLWFQYGPGGSAPQSDLDFLAQNGADAWSAQVSPNHYGTNVSLLNCTAKIFDVAGHTLRESQKTPADAWHGVATDACLPWETSLCISLYTYVPDTFVPNGRRQRGRYYLPPMVSTVLEGGNSGFVQNALLPTLLGEQVNFYGKLYAGAGFDPLVVIPIVYSRSAGKDSDPVPPEFYIVSHLVADAKIDSQRRRQNREDAGRIVQPITG